MSGGTPFGLLTPQVDHLQHEINGGQLGPAKGASGGQRPNVLETD